MPEVRLEIKPGIDTTLTEATNRGGWSSSSRVRFREGRIERLRGREAISPNAVVPGVARSMHWWTDLRNKGRIAVGTSASLFLWDSNDKETDDVTPAGLTPGLVSSQFGNPFSLRIWSLDNFGQDLLAIPSGGTIYVWRPAVIEEPEAPAVPVTPPSADTIGTFDVPQHCQGGFVTMPERIFVVYGTNWPPPNSVTGPGGPFTSTPPYPEVDPMLIRWSTQDDYTVWNVRTDNFAGSYRIPRGSRIVGGIQAPLGAYIWTDIDCWTMTFQGQPYVFGFFQLANNCGLIAQKAVVVAGSAPMWMSDHGFFTTTGQGVQQIPCTVWDYVFLDMDEDNQDKCFAALDYHFNEVRWFFPSKSGGTGEIDSYAKYNFVDQIWDCGRIVRTAWVDQNRPGFPVSVGLDGILCQNALGLDDNGHPVVAFAQSGFQDLSDGQDMQFIEFFMPDMIWEGNGPDGQGPRADITLFFRRYPAEPATAIGPFTIGPRIRQVTLAQMDPSGSGIVQRPRGREWAIRIDWHYLDSWCRWGAPRLQVSPDGRWS